MKWLNKLWPWKEIARLEKEVRELNVKLVFERDKHSTTLEELRAHKARNEQNQHHLRKAAQILALKGGIL